MVYVILGTGFEEVEALAPVDLMRRAGLNVQTVGITGKMVYGSHHIGVEADILPEEMDLGAMEMIVLPGGLGGCAIPFALALIAALKGQEEADRIAAQIVIRT